MPNYKDSYINVRGSDNNIYLVEMEHIDRNTIELSLVMDKTKIDRDGLNVTNSAIPSKMMVESFIRQYRERFGVSKEEVYDILYILTNSTVSNHFDYLKLLREVVPKIEKLLQ